MKNIIITLICLLSFQTLAAPRITVSVNPNRSQNGESVLFKIDVQVDSSVNIASPNLHNLVDWELVNSFKTSGSRVSYINGQTQYLFQAEFSFILRPLKEGAVNIPSINLDIAGKTYKTDSLTVQVSELPGGMARRDRFNNKPYSPPGQNRLPPGGSTLNPGFAPSPSQNSRGMPTQVPANETFFIRPEINTTNPWMGQLVELTYVLYQRSLNVRNFEMAKFPDFKGFLKEELFITKGFAHERVQIGNEVLYRSDIIRYALFPIKGGPISIQPFEARAEVFTSPDDLINSLIMGTPPPTMRGPIPMNKSSGSVELNVRELPPTPAQTQFTGAVGQFNLEIKGPEGKLEVDQPFTIQLTFAGKGNVKMIEEAQLPLPKSLELFQTKNSSEIRSDATGYKTFEYLILPRATGEHILPAFKWSYFDPEVEEYKILETDSLRFNVEAGSGAPRKEMTIVKEYALSPFDVVVSPLKNKNSSNSSYVRIWIGILAILFIFLGWTWFRRRHEEENSLRLQNNPWEKTALSIRNKSYKNSVALCILIDQWTREYLSGHLIESELHSESPRNDFEKVIRYRTPNEFQNQIPELLSFWNDLDLARFAGSKKWPLSQSPEELFPKAEQICKKLISRCKSPEELKIFDED